MERTPIDSSSLASIGYEPRSRVLEVEFRSGRIYRYRGVPPGVYRRLLQADSAGRYLNLEIKGSYPYREV